MNTLDAILASIVAEPDPATWLVLADWLEEHDDPGKSGRVRFAVRPAAAPIGLSRCRSSGTGI